MVLASYAEKNKVFTLDYYVFCFVLLGHALDQLYWLNINFNLIMELLTFTTSVTILVLHVPSFHTRNPTLPNPGTSPVLTTTFVILPELSWELLTAETCLVVSLLPYPILILNGPSHWSYTRDFERCLFCCHFWFPLEHKTCIWIYTLNVLKYFGF